MTMYQTRWIAAAAFVGALVIGCAPNARVNTAPEHAGTDGGGATVPVSAPASQPIEPSATQGYGRSTPGWVETVKPNEAGSPGGMAGADKAPKATHAGDDGHGTGHGSEHAAESGH